MAKKRLGLISHDFYPYQGGLGRHATSLLKELNAYLTNFELIGVSPLENKLANHVSSLSFTKNLPADQIQFSLFYQFAQQQIVRKLNLDAIILNGGPGGVFCLRKPEVPLLYIANHTYAQQSKLVPGEAWKKCFIPFEKKGYSNANVITAISKTTKESLLNDYQIPAEKVRVIPPGFHFDSEPEISLSRGKDFLFVGRLDKRKGIRFLLEAFAKGAEQLTDGKLHIVGTGKDAEKLKRYGASHCRDRVVFHGFLPDDRINEITRTCCAQIIPSRLEGFGLVAVESIKRGLPVLASKSAGLSDIVIDGKSGRTFSFGDAESLIAVCSYAQKHPREMCLLAKHAYNNAKERLSWNTIGNKYDELLASLFTP